MKYQYFKKTKSTATKTVEYDEQMRAKHQEKEAKSRCFYQKQNGQYCHLLETYCKNEIAALHNKLIHVKPSCMNHIEAEFKD